MAIVGNNPATPDLDYTRGLNSTPHGLRITMPEAANGAASIWWYGSTETGASIEAAVYEDGSDPPLIVEAAASYTTVAADQWHEVPLNSLVVSNGEIVIITITDSAAAGSVLAYANGGGNTDGWRDDYGNLYSSGWLDPATGAWNPGTVIREFTMYLEYTPDAGGATISNIVGNGGLAGNGSLIVGPGGLVG